MLAFFEQCHQNSLIMLPLLTFAAIIGFTVFIIVIMNTPETPEKPHVPVQALPDATPATAPRVNYTAPFQDIRSLREEPAFFERIGAPADTEIEEINEPVLSPYILDLSGEDAHRR